MSNNNFNRKGPFSSYEKAFTQGLRDKKGFGDATVAEQLNTQKKQIERKSSGTGSIDIQNLPSHLFVPYGAESIDIRRVETVPAGTNLTILDWTIPKGMEAHFISYGIYNDGLLLADYEFRPTVNGQRVFRFHGDNIAGGGNLNFKIGLGLSPDLSNSSLIDCQLTLQPNDRVKWQVFNSASVDTIMGVRMRGWVASSEIRKEANFGY